MIKFLRTPIHCINEIVIIRLICGWRRASNRRKERASEIEREFVISAFFFISMFSHANRTLIYWFWTSFIFVCNSSQITEFRQHSAECTVIIVLYRVTDFTYSEIKRIKIWAENNWTKKEIKWNELGAFACKRMSSCFLLAKIQLHAIRNERHAEEGERERGVEMRCVHNFNSLPYIIHICFVI